MYLTSIRPGMSFCIFQEFSNENRRKVGIVRGYKIIKDPYGEAENSNIDYVKQRELRINIST